jgi:hypothetical protein
MGCQHPSDWWESNEGNWLNWVQRDIAVIRGTSSLLNSQLLIAICNKLPFRLGDLGIFLVVRYTAFESAPFFSIGKEYVIHHCHVLLVILFRNLVPISAMWSRGSSLVPLRCLFFIQGLVFR